MHVNMQRLEIVDDLLKGWRHEGRFLELHVALRLHRLRRGLRDTTASGNTSDPFGGDAGWTRP